MARVERIESRGLPVPEYLTPPDVLPGYDDWFTAFWYLSRDRIYGGPIPAASIDRHAAGMTDGEAALFRSVICAMDDVYLRHLLPDTGGNASPENARDAFRSAAKAHFEGRNA